MDVTIVLTDDDVAAILAVTGHTPQVFFDLRLNDVVQQHASIEKAKKIALYNKSTPEDRAAIDALLDKADQ